MLQFDTSQTFTKSSGAGEQPVVGEVSPEIALLRPNANLAFNPDDWLEVKPYTNCYTYALNIPAHGHGRPGQLLWSPEERLEADSDRTKCNNDDLLRYAERDGLVKVSLKDVHLSEHHVVALFCAPYRDFHLMRYDSLQHSWSHYRGGGGIITDRDYSDDTIHDPEACDRGPYREMVGYFVVPEAGIKYRVDPEGLEYVPESLAPEFVEP